MLKGLAKWIVATFILGGVGAGLWVQLQLRAVGPRSAAVSPREQVTFVVASGMTTKRVAQQLKQMGLFRSAAVYELLVRSTGSKLLPKAGEYLISSQMPALEIARVLSSGKSIEQVITVPEGYNRFEIADLVARSGLGSRQEFLRKTQDAGRLKEWFEGAPPSLEGFLFPDTYAVTKAAGVDGLIDQMLKRFRAQFLELKRSRPSGVQLNDLEWVTLASIVEKETGAQFERATISAVFHNRLKLNMRLQTDPTVVYGIWLKEGTWDGKIGRKDLLQPTDYNTYTKGGLPPGPIANPGREALLAARQPNSSDALFFVSRNDGTHVFSSNLESHNKAVRDFQLNPKAREGKSWRDLKQ